MEALPDPGVVLNLSSSHVVLLVAVRPQPTYTHTHTHSLTHSLTHSHGTTHTHSAASIVKLKPRREEVDFTCIVKTV
jgi:hypothetical protein